MALFKPDPDVDSPEDIIEELARELSTRYRDVEDLLLAEVTARAIRDAQLSALLPDALTAGGLTVTQRRDQNRILAELAAHRAASYRDLQRIADELVGRLNARELAEQIVRIAAEQGEAAAAAVLGFASANSIVTLPTSFGATLLRTTATSTAAQAVAMVALSLQNRLEVLNQRITRYPQDAFQRIVAIHSPSTLLGVTTSRIQQSLTVQRFLSEGIPGFVDKANRRWTIGAYAEMAGRTSVNRAFNDAGVWRMQQVDINLVTVVRGIDSCRKCAEWAGAILSTDGTTGTVTLPHATGGEEVTVTIRATVDQARASGWNHPNCRCRLVAYSPGLTVPQGDTTYDEAAEKERAKQRELERDIRSAKRREASALNDVDRKRASADVRDAQGNMRDFIKQTGRNRDSYREQLHFADGKGSTTPPKPPRATGPPQAVFSSVPQSLAIRSDGVISTQVAGERAPQHIPSTLHLEPHEIASGERLAAAGISVSWREIDNSLGAKNPDATLNEDPALWDFKSPKGNGSSTLSNQLRRAKEQGVDRVVIDMARTQLDEQESLAELRRRLAGYDWLTAAIFIDRSGQVTWLTKE